MKRITVFALISAEAAVKALADADYFSPQDAFALAMWINRVEPVLLAARKRNCPSQSCSALRTGRPWKVPDASIAGIHGSARDECISVQIDTLDAKLLEQARISPGMKSLLIPFI